jgi:hypothetical protein
MKKSIRKYSAGKKKNCHSALDAESVVPILDSCFRRNDKQSNCNFSRRDVNNEKAICYSISG